MIVGSFASFLLAGVIGILSSRLPIDKTLMLFPILSGFFGISVLIVQIKSRSKIPKQEFKSDPVDKKNAIKSVVFGSFGGILSGILPGVGSSEIAGTATVDKNNKSFLITLGSITSANILLSFLALWLIGNPRSGVAVALDHFMKIGFSEFILIVVVTIISVSIAVLSTLVLSKKIIKSLERINYSMVNKIAIIFLTVLIFTFTGPLGLLLAVVCSSLGIFVNLIYIKRGLLMGVLIIPTILFYIGI